MIYTFRVLVAHHEFIVDARLDYSGSNYMGVCPPDINVEEIHMTLGTRKRPICWQEMDYRAKNKIVADIQEQLEDA